MFQFCYRVFPILLLVLASFYQNAESIALDEEAEKVLQDIIAQYEANPQDARFEHVVHTPQDKCHLFPKVFIWCPVTRFKLDLHCPVHNVPMKLGRWMSNLATEGSDNPRLVYDIGGNILFVQRHYSCGKCLEGTRGNGHRYMSGAVEIMDILPLHVRQSLPIEVHFKCALSRNLLDFVLIMVQQGTNFVRICQSISSLNFREYATRHSNPRPGMLPSPQEMESDFYDDTLYSFPSNDKLMHLFLNYYEKVKDVLEQDMRSHIGNILICDHTFKIGSHIGPRTAGQRKAPSDGQFDHAFIGLNEFGEVMFLRLTRDSSFDQIEDLLQDFKQRLSSENMQLDLILVEDCCVDQNRFHEIFGEVPVKLSLFHAWQRVLATLPPGYDEAKKFAKEFRLVFRAQDDQNEERLQNTPSGPVIADNLERFMHKWSVKLPDETVESIVDLKEHIDRGCLSDIPPGEGTERNERLHNFLSDSLLCAARTLSPELAIAILAYVLYVWNCQKKGKKHSSNSRVIPTVPVECKRNLNAAGFYEACLKSNGKLDSSLIWEKAATLGMHPFLQVEFEAVGDVACLENENVVKYAITRALHLQDIFQVLARKCDKKDLNIVEFPYYYVKGYSFLLRCTPGAGAGDEILNSDVMCEANVVNMEALQRNLASFGLERDAVAMDGNCCFSSIVTQLYKIKDVDVNQADYMTFLEQLGLFKSIEEDITTLRSLFTKEVSINLETYKKWTSLSEGDLEAEIEHFNKDGWFSTDIGDLCVMVCARIIQAPIVVITSYEHAPYLPFLPEKLSSSVPLFVAFDHSAPGHYDSTKELSVFTNPSLRCCCGRVRKGEKTVTRLSCTDSDQSSTKCPCFKMNQPCSRLCRCKNCDNAAKTSETKYQSKKNRKSCMCGNGRKADDTAYIACKDKVDGGRKSKCPCLRNNLGCTSDCRCRNCANIHNSGDDLPGKRNSTEETGPAKIKRRRKNPQSYKRLKGTEFVSSQEIEVSTEVWSELETIMLIVIHEILFLTNLPMETANVIPLYHFIAASGFVTDMGLPLTNKEPAEIEAKLLEMQNKQQLFLSVLSPDISS